MEASRAAGGTPLQVQPWGPLPQALPEIVAVWLYRFEINIRAAAILGVVGAGGIGAIVRVHADELAQPELEESTPAQINRP